MRENASAKARRLLVEGRLIVTNVDARGISARCRGDSGRIYGLGWNPNDGWCCDCTAGQFRASCAHRQALQLVTVIDQAGER